MAEFLEMPDFVQNKILEYLPSEDQLNLRRACHTTKFWVEGHTDLAGKWSKYQITINEKEGNHFSSFLKLNLKIPNLFIDNKDFKIYSDPSAILFLQGFGSSIKKLRVRNFNACRQDAEYTFFMGFPNLEELEIDYINLFECPNIPPRYPETLKNLKILKPHKLTALDTLEEFYHWDLIGFCSGTEILRKPEVEGEWPGMSPHPQKDMGYLMDIVLEREKSYPEVCKVKFIDLKNVVDYDNRMRHHFLTLVNFCFEKGVKLINVHAHLLEGINPVGPPEPTEIWKHCDEIIVSLINVNPHVRLLGLENMEKLTVTSTHESSIWDQWDFLPSWPSLSCLSIHFDSNTKNFREEAWPLQELLGFLVICEDSYGIDRDRNQVEDLTVTFVRGSDNVTLTDAQYLHASSIARNFPNLKKLKIVGWDTKNICFMKLWKKLNKLEELWIEDCQTLGNVGIIGEDIANPVFSGLTGLKKLTLKLDSMPKITDRAFKDVFSKMSLTHLNLLSDKPLTNITMAGIEALAKGPFSTSVKKFSFKGFTLANVSKEEFNRLQNLFRCNQ